MKTGTAVGAHPTVTQSFGELLPDLLTSPSSDYGSDDEKVPSPIRKEKKPHRDLVSEF